MDISTWYTGEDIVEMVIKSKLSHSQFSALIGTSASNLSKIKQNGTFDSADCLNIVLGLVEDMLNNEVVGSALLMRYKEVKRL